MVKSPRDMIDTGLLWYINKSCFHPHGYSLAIRFDGKDFHGWQLLGDGTEPWNMGTVDEDEKFIAFQKLLKECKNG